MSKSKKAKRPKKTKKLAAENLNDIGTSPTERGAGGKDTVLTAAAFGTLTAIALADYSPALASLP